MRKCAVCNYDDQGTGDTAHICGPFHGLTHTHGASMKKGDRIRCKRACGELPKGAEGICEKEPGPTGGLGLFQKGAYGIGHSDWYIYFEVIPDNSLADFSALEVQQGGTQKLERFLVFAWDKGRAKGGANDLVLDTPKYELAMNHISTHHDCVQIVDSELGITLYQKVVL